MSTWNEIASATFIYPILTLSWNASDKESTFNLSFTRRGIVFICTNLKTSSLFCLDFEALWLQCLVKYTKNQPCHFNLKKGVFSIDDQSSWDERSSKDKVYASLSLYKGTSEISLFLQQTNLGTERNEHPWLSIVCKGYNIECQYFLYLISILGRLLGLSIDK